MATGSKPPPPHAPRYQYGPTGIQNVEGPPPIGDPDHQLGSYGPYEHLTAGADFTGANPACQAVCPTMGHVNYGPSGPPECCGSQTHRPIHWHPTPETTHYIPVTPSHTQPEYSDSAPVAPPQEFPNDGALTGSCVPLPHNAAGPSRGGLAPGHPGISTDEDLKRLARQYLLSFGSRVDKLRMRRSRSGALKVLILLEIEDMM
ncbi:hypothetical protein BC826DRAFT_714082 [Russula brevipes]|nr:hypothetical protein BC826DRAFT_714082 [Russula brevipes]